MKLLSSIISSIKLGPGETSHSNGGIIRYYIEDALANEIDHRIKNVFKIDLREKNQCKKAETHFLVYYRNRTFFFNKVIFTIWNVFLAHFKNDGKPSELYFLPKTLAVLNDVAIFFYLLFLTVYRFTSNLSFHNGNNLSNCWRNKGAMDAVNIAVQYYHGVNPAKRNDLFALEALNKNLQYNCFIFTDVNGNYKKLLNELRLFEYDIKNGYGFNIELIPVHLNTLKVSSFWPSLKSSVKLFKHFELSFINNPLVLLFMIIFNYSKISYGEFFKTCRISIVTNTNFNFNSSLISGAAYDAKATSVFKEVSVWGDWSTVYINKVICNEWLSITTKSSVYAKNTHIFVDKFVVKKNKHLSLSKTKKSRSLRIFIFGTNAGKNNSFFIPQTISSTLYNYNLNAFFDWSVKKNDIKITIKEKKTNSDFYINTLKKNGSMETSVHNQIEFIATHSGRTLPELCDGYDLYVALGTFYPSCIYEISDYIPKDRLVFWDMAGLSRAFPKVLETATMSVCTSLDEIINFCEDFYYNNRKSDTKSTRGLL